MSVAGLDFLGMVTFETGTQVAATEMGGLSSITYDAARNVYYASGFWTRISEWGFQENQAAVVIPRDPAKPSVLVVPMKARRACWPRL